MTFRPNALAALVFATVSATVSATLPLEAHDVRAGDLVIDHPVAAATAPGSRSAAAYLSITNTGTAADRLVGVRADVPQALLHESVIEDGIARMLHHDAIEIAPGATVVLAPGGLHIMLMGLAAPLEAGMTVPATLIFEGAGEVGIEIAVEPRPGSGAAAKNGGSHAGHPMKP